ncbi:site-specific integrase [Candidatus Gottesmanbacteria bacterium]|nr:site-specific integrase [Candidatus Gottesmanbacteria bacterium]
MNFLYDHYGMRKYLTITERNAFLEAARKLAPEVYTFCATLTYTGARISEALAITPNRIDFDAGVIVIESMKKRQRGVYRAVPLPSAFIQELDLVHGILSSSAAEGTGDFRLWPWSRTTAWKRIKTCMNSAQLSGVHATPKGLRHSFAVGAIQAGIPITLVRKWLGHARLSTTEIYMDAVGYEERTIAARFWRSF